MSQNRISYTPVNWPRRLLWVGYALLLAIAPLIFHSGASLSLLSQMGTVMIFSLSFNMLLGQGGMLSFGHAVYSGLGAFFAIHAMNLAASKVLPIPVSLIPLVGGIAGAGFGVLFGYVTTRKSGTTFAMITLGIVELVFASSLMFPEFFGGEGGISTNRVIGEPVLGISFGPQIQVYYLIAFWLLLSTLGMYAFTRTPLGRIVNAVRDNPERAEFIGYDAQWVRYLVLIISAFFAGISGGLSAINFEIVSAENVSAVRSGAVLFFVFIGGAGYFFGPMIGAVIGVFLTVMLSDYTKAWQLYLGLFFILMVLMAPGGLASLVAANLRLAKFGRFRAVWRYLGPTSVALLIAAAGAIAMIEMLYHLQLDNDAGSEMDLFWMHLDVATSPPWLAALAVLIVGTGLAWPGIRKSKQAWGDASAWIEQQMIKGGA